MTDHAELIEPSPVDRGEFVGDIFYGDPTNSTRGTHRWTGAAWEALPTDAEVLTLMLAEARARVDALVAERDALAAEVAKLRELSEKREQDAANDRAFNKGGVKNYDDQLAQAWAEIRALNDDLVALPEAPSIDTMRCLLSAGMNIHNPDTGALGRNLQRRTSKGTIPYAAEFECAAGLWCIIREAVIARAALAQEPRNV